MSEEPCQSPPPCSDPPESWAPPGALVQVMRQCNYTCRHCSQSAPLLSREEKDKIASELPLLLNRIDRLHALGIRRIRFTGGEPFLHPGLSAASSHARSKGMEVSFVTNGSRLGEFERTWLKGLGPTEIWLSFYGYPPEIHDRVCGHSGAYARARVTLAALLDDGHQVGLHYPLSNQSAAGCPTFVSEMAETGVKAIKVMQLFEQGRAETDFNSEARHLPELVPVLIELREIAQRYQKLDLRVSLRSGQRMIFEKNHFQVPAETGCHASLNGFWTLDAEGFIYPCCLFLNSGKMRVIHIDHPDLVQVARTYDHQMFIARLHAAEATFGCGALTRCPALIPHEDELDQFICPLIYSRPVSKP